MADPLQSIISFALSIGAISAIYYLWFRAKAYSKERIAQRREIDRCITKNFARQEFSFEEKQSKPGLWRGSLPQNPDRNISSCKANYQCICGKVNGIEPDGPLLCSECDEPIVPVPEFYGWMEMPTVSEKL